MSEVEELADALAHDSAADHVLIPTPVVASWLARFDPKTNELPMVHKAGRRDEREGAVRKFAQVTARACLERRWVVETDIRDLYRITPAGRKALERHTDVTRRAEQVGAS